MGAMAEECVYLDTQSQIRFDFSGDLSNKAFGAGSNMTIAEAVTLAAQASLEASKLGSVLGGSSTASQWAAAIQIPEGCAAALGRASDALR